MPIELPPHPCHPQPARHLQDDDFLHLVQIKNGFERPTKVPCQFLITVLAPQLRLQTRIRHSFIASLARHTKMKWNSWE